MQQQAKIIDGKARANILLADLKKKIDEDTVNQLKPAKLAIILVGEEAASQIYVRNKIKAAQKVGIEIHLAKFATNVTQRTLLDAVGQLNNDPLIDGIIVQLPLPKHIDQASIIGSIAPKKDVDGFHPINLGLLFSSHKHNFVPCTALGCFDLIKTTNTKLTGKKVVIVGRSNIVGRPLAALLLKADCSVTICHSKTVNLMSLTKQADIVIAAMGQIKFLTKEYFRQDVIIIDVGINRHLIAENYKLFGDVDFDNLVNIASYITPVPGGVGPMTVAYLLINSYIARFGQKYYNRKI